MCSCFSINIIGTPYLLICTLNFITGDDRTPHFIQFYSAIDVSGYQFGNGDSKTKGLIQNLSQPLNYDRKPDLVEPDAVIHEVERFFQCAIGLFLIDALFEGVLHGIDHLIEGSRLGSFCQAVESYHKYTGISNDGL